MKFYYEGNYHKKVYYNNELYSDKDNGLKEKLNDLFKCSYFKFLLSNTCNYCITIDNKQYHFMSYFIASTVYTATLIEEKLKEIGIKYYKNNYNEIYLDEEQSEKFYMFLVINEIV